jgi:Xaa-Pro aminopeptidase
MTSPSEMREKQRRVHEFLERHGYDALLLVGSDNFAWYTCGGSDYVNTADTGGVAALLLSRERRVLLTNNVEQPRLLTEEVMEQGFEEEIAPWHEDAFPPMVARLAPGQRIASDVPFPGTTACPEAIGKLRRSLTPEEVSRYRVLGAEVGAALGEACLQLSPGMTEYEAAAAVSETHYARGIVPIVVLVAADARLLRYRHPLPTANPIQHTVMLVVCGRRQGLIVSATRIVHFGSHLSDELRRKHQAVVNVDAVMNTATRPGTRIGDIFTRGVEAYAAQGFAEEWRLHHQGGPTGYAARDYRAVAGTDDVVELYQAFAWNPSITGTKSEDTILATPEGPEVISASPSFPALTVTANGVTLERADILLR